MTIAPATPSPEAILLVGGKGTRLRPMTVHTPKPMVPAAGVPFLTHQLARARAAGVEHIVLATSYLAEVFEPYFGDGSALGLHLEYVTEEEPLGTGGAIRNVASRLRSGPDDPVLIFNGDILTGLDIRALVDNHRTTGADVSLHLTRVPDPRAYGLVPTDEQGRVTAFLEKPQTPEEIVTDQINAGAYVFNRSVIDTIPADRPVSVERETFPGLLATGAHLQGMVDSTYWLDLGTPRPSSAAPRTWCSAGPLPGRPRALRRPPRPGQRLGRGRRQADRRHRHRPTGPGGRGRPHRRQHGAGGRRRGGGRPGVRLAGRRGGTHRRPYGPAGRGGRRRCAGRPGQRAAGRRTGVVRRGHPGGGGPLLVRPVTGAP
ncbi:hypothetical protein SSPO_059850 [Streptomyces antimycoticus]|uniref:Nucleotidyl transferase domain-containing protein n=1 Tax=Streptomyces antimycoticus TaxID=68175 RepID=A0A499VAW3_9ACTN|nr:hypothetical protein SSPO_059850 [Streptomyces antimycoticus]